MEDTTPSTPNPSPNQDITPPVNTEPTPTPAEPATPGVVQANSAPPTNKRKMTWIVLTVIVLLAAGGAYLALNKVNKPATQTVQSTKKSVALVRVGVVQPFLTAFYPKSETSILPFEINSQMFEGLTKYQNENQVAPNLADSWTNPDSKTWDFKLHPGVKFHNGDAFNAQAVKDSLDALQSTDYGKAYGTSIASTTVKDNLDIEIKTSAPDPLLPNELANLWIYDTKSTKQNDPSNGTGPYTIKPGTTLTADTLDLVAVSDYHGGTPMTKEVIFKYYADDASINKDVKAGKLDIADLTSASAVDSVKQLGFSPYVDKNPQVFFLIPNSLKAGSPLQKLGVRQAIYEGLDPLAIMKADGRTGTAATQFVPKEIPGYNPAIVRPKADVAKAKTDLATAGYAKGFTITFTYFASHQAMALEAQKQFAAMGITLTLDPETSGPALQKKALGGQTDMFYFAFSSSLIDSSDVISPLVVGSANYKNDSIDKLFQQASTTLNSKDRLQLLQQINKAAMDDVAGFPLFVPDGIYFAVKSNLVVHTDNLTDYLGVDFWKVYSQ